MVPAGVAPEDPRPLASDDPADLDFAALTASPDRHGLPGVQAKASASMVNTPLALRGSRALLMIDPPDHPHLVENEALHLAGARALRIPVAEHTVVHDQHGRVGLLVTRFNRERQPDGSFRRLALEDAAQALDVYPAQKYAVTTEEAILALTGLTAAQPVAARNLYLQFLYAWLTGNGDLHAKNVSVLQGADGRWQVAPVYDVPCTALYRDMTMALSVDGRVKGLRRRHWEALADAVGLPRGLRTPPCGGRSPRPIAWTSARCRSTASRCTGPSGSCAIAVASCGTEPGDAVVGFQRYPPCERRCSQRPCCVSENDGDARVAPAKAPFAPVLRERKRRCGHTFPLSSRCQ